MRFNRPSTDAINIYVANHRSLTGITDFLIIFKFIFERCGIKFIINNTIIENSVNIIIDEFSSEHTRSMILASKYRTPSTKFILVATEFIGFAASATTFNPFFSAHEERYFASLMDEENRRGRFRACHRIVNSAIKPIFARVSLGKARQSAISYNHSRFIGFAGALDLFDQVICAHPQIADEIMTHFPSNASKISGSLFPEFPLDWVKARYGMAWSESHELCFEMTGSLTPHRRAIAKRIDSMTVNRPGWKMCQTHGFRKLDLGEYLLAEHFAERRAANDTASPNKAKIKKPAFSLHPPQTATWDRASPTRIFRAIFLDETVPVVTSVTGDHPIEGVCLYFDEESTLLRCEALFRETENRKAWLSGALDAYTRKVVPLNDAWIGRLG